MRRDPNRVDEECVCFDSLVQRIKAIQGTPSITFQRLDEGQDPPDFWLSIGAQHYAVEVTSIVTDQGYWALCDSLETSIRMSLQSDPEFGGSYVLRIFRKPHIPKRNSKAWYKLIAKARACIHNLSNSTSGSESTLVEDLDGVVAIVKWSNEGAMIGAVRTPEAKWQGEAQIELATLISNAVDRKINAIQRRSIESMCDGVILALYDAYGYSHLSDAQVALESVPGYRWFHSIFWASSFSGCENITYPDNPGRVGAFLYSKNPSWIF